MAYRDIVAEIRGIPKMNLPLSQTYVQRAMQKILNESLWSFQLQEGGWFTPSLVNAGRITTQLFTNTLVGDAAASAAWQALPAGFLITNYQIRIPAYAIYNIVAIDTTVPAAVVLTLDRPWMEPDGANQPYQMYQCYYVAPTDGWKCWLAVRDFTNAANLDWWSKKQQDLDADDPQRTVFQNPAVVVPYRIDNRPGTSTPGRMLFELYPQPLAKLPYALYFVSDPPPMVNPGDIPPYPLTDEVVVYRAKEQTYLWCEENKGRYPELAKSDWSFLAEAAKSMYDDRLKDIRKSDRDICDSFMTTLRRKGGTLGGPFYSAVTGQAQVGVF